MNGTPKSETITGTIQRIDISGLGVNSGEFSLVIAPETPGAPVAVFGGIIPSIPPNPDDPSWKVRGLENGVFASYCQAALIAYSTGRKIECTYVHIDKPRVSGISFRN